MSIANTVNYALALTRVDYEILRHHHSETSLAAARTAHVDPGSLAKAVVLHDEIGPLLAVVPASESLDLERLRKLLRRPALDFISEEKLDQVFYDCDKGAIPPLGPDYRVPTVVDARLRNVEDVYFEAGDHEDLVHVDQTSFRTLMRGAEYLEIVADG
ncbi:MAG TPA: YbaK/EbsC family protein [Gammaproteobacteria bacterium]|nr:YbaK/EbsC family protein [Gammaproteobacteria bacterium]